jgi:hypothetical protein
MFFRMLEKISAVWAFLFCPLISGTLYSFGNFLIQLKILGT